MYDSEMLLSALVLGTFSAVVIFGILPALAMGEFHPYAIIIIMITIAGWVWFAHTSRHW